LGRKEPGEDSVLGPHASFVVAEDEAVMEIRRDEAELRPQIEDIPVIAAKHPDGGRCVSVVRCERAILVCEESNERRLPGAVGTENRRVLADVDRERQPVENGTILSDDRGVRELEDGIRHYGKCEVESRK